RKMNINTEGGAVPAEGVIIGSTREIPPLHYNFKIQSFSLLSKNSLRDTIQLTLNLEGTNDFAYCVCAHRKLSLYPNGNAGKNGKDHISLYLLMTDTDSLTSGWEVNVVYRLFLYDQIRDKYLAVEVDDACVFGAEVFVYKSIGKGESLSATAVKHTWKIESFSQKDNLLKSEMFTAANHKWLSSLTLRNLELYPKGHSIGKNKYASVYLRLADSKTTSTGGKLLIGSVRRATTGVNNKTKDFLMTDALIVEAEVTVLGIAKTF
ncbi:hypothetical protein GIB67_021908, partial [Kingdonia uniflora]